MGNAEEIYLKLLSPIEKKMIATVYRIMGNADEAADVLQEVQAVIWKKLKRIHRHPNPHAYIMRICISRSYDALRKRNHRYKHEMPFEQEAFEKMRTQEDINNTNEEEGLISKAIFTLPQKQSKAVLLRFLDDESYESIGEILGCAEVTARSHVSKGLAKLKNILLEMGVYTRGDQHES